MVIGCYAAIFVCVYKVGTCIHDAILICSKTVFVGISHASRLVFLGFHGIGERIGKKSGFP